MRRPSRLVPLVPLLALAALAVSGCATMNVSAHMQRGLDFAPYHSYDWGPADALPTGDPRLDQDPYFKDQLEGVVEKQMVLRGFERPSTGTPDLLIHYHASITERLNVDAQRYEASTLVVDVVDASTNVLMWRGWASGSVEGVLGNRDRLRRRIDNDVAGIFESLPHRD